MSNNLNNLPVVVVTGANGWLGRSAISVLNERYPMKFRIIAVTRQPLAISEKLSPTFLNCSYGEVEKLEIPVTGFIHTAFKTQNFLTENNFQNYMNENLEIIEWSRQYFQKLRPDWAISISSGAAKEYLYKKSRDINLTIKDIYGELKAFEEKVFLNSDISNVAIGRLWAASGRHMQNYEIYALGDFISKAYLGLPISVNGSGDVKRRYTDAEDFLDLLLNCVWENSRTIIDSGGHLIGIHRLAELVASQLSFRLGREINIKFMNQQNDSDRANYFPVANRSDLLMERFGIKPIQINQQILRTLDAVKNKLEKKYND